MTDESKDKMSEPIVGNMQDYKDLADKFNKQVCPQCGYCPCCGRPRGNFYYPVQPPYYFGWPYMQWTC